MIGKDEVTSSTLVSSSTRNPLKFQGVLSFLRLAVSCDFVLDLQKVYQKVYDAFLEIHKEDEVRSEKAPQKVPKGN